MDTKLLKQFVKERDEAILTFDIEVFKKFYIKWVKLGVYKPNFLPNDNKILEISLRKMVLGMANPPEDKAREAREWLRARGYKEGF